MKCVTCKSEDLDLDEETCDEGDTVTCGECGAVMTVTIVRKIRLTHAEVSDEDSDSARVA